MLSINQVSLGYGSQRVLQQISFHVNRGEIFGIVGPNGSGKTTLLKALNRGLPLDEGNIIFDRKPLHSYTSKELARKMAVLPQESQIAFNYRVYDIVAMGRYPYQKGLLQSLTARDRKAITRALKLTDTERFRERHLLELSGGERQRVLLARTLAQEPEVLLLDELTNYLDLSHQMNILNLLHERSRRQKLTVVAILHDLNLASLYCDRILLLNEGNLMALDEAQKVLDEKSLSQVYETELKRGEHPFAPSPIVTFVPDTEENRTERTVDELQSCQEDDYFQLSSPSYWKTFTTRTGFGWHKTFYHSHLEHNEACLLDTQSLVMRSGAQHKPMFMSRSTLTEKKALVVMFADSIKLDEADKSLDGTITIWIFVEGGFSEADYAQLLMAVTEAKATALCKEGVDRAGRGSAADQVLIAASPIGEQPSPASSFIKEVCVLIEQGVDQIVNRE